MIVLIGGEKGGTGKSTLATNLAAFRKQSGRDVLLVDTDIQASSSNWAAIRSEGSQPRVPCIQKFGKGLQAEIQDLKQRYQDIVIDAGGRDSAELRASLVVSDVAYIPVCASQYDIWTLERMNGLVETARGFNPQINAFVIINRASTNPVVAETDEAREFVEGLEHLELSEVVVRERITFRKATRGGLSIDEVSPRDNKAWEEVQALYSEVFDGTSV